MKRNFKKMLVVLLTIAMLLSNMNLQAFAAETEGEEATETVVEQVQEQPSVEEEQADEEPAPVETDTGDKQDQPEETPSVDQKEDPPVVDENTEPTEQEKENDPVVTDENDGEDQKTEDPAEKEGEEQKSDDKAEPTEEPTEGEKPEVTEEQPEVTEEQNEAVENQKQEEEPAEDPEQKNEAPEETPEEVVKTEGEQTEEVKEENKEDPPKEEVKSDESQEEVTQKPDIPPAAAEGENTEVKDEEKTEEEPKEENPWAPVEYNINPINLIESFYTMNDLGRFWYPVVSPAVVSTEYGAVDELHPNGHFAIDYAAPEGTPVIAVAAGTVKTAHVWQGTRDGATMDSYGNYVEIVHPDGTVTIYGHLSEINVAEGQEVIQGQQIGLVGNTGRSDGSHLHFEVDVNGSPVDPTPYFIAKTIQVEVYGWGADIKAGDDALYEAHNGSLYADENSKIFKVTGEHTALLYADNVDYVTINAHYVWTYGSAEIIYEDGTSETRNAIGEAINLDGVVKIVLNAGGGEGVTLQGEGFPLKNEAEEEPAPRLRAPMLRAALPQPGDSVQITIYPNGSSSGYASDGTGRSYAGDMSFWCFDSEMNTPETGYTYTYQALSTFSASYNIDVLNYILYNGYAIHNSLPVTFDFADPGSSTVWTTAFDRDWICLQAVWVYVYHIKHGTSSVGALYDYYDKGATPAEQRTAVHMVEEALAYAAGGGSKPESRFKKSIAILTSTSAGSLQPLISIGPVPYGYVQVHKENTDVSAAFLAEHPVTGAVYGIFTNQNTANSAQAKQTPTNTSIGTEGTCATVTIGANAYSDIAELDPGDYWIVEITRPTDPVWQWDSVVHAVNVSEGSEADPVVITSEEPATSYVYLQKSSSNTALTNENPLYNLVGATYELYDNINLSGDPVATLVVQDSTGKTNTEEVPIGTYYFKETVAGTGYELKTYDRNTDHIEVTAANTVDNPAIIETTDKPINDPARLSIYKVEVGSGNRITDYSATFKVEYFENYSSSGTVERTWYYKTISGIIVLWDESYLDTTYNNAPRYKDENGAVTFPLGSIRVTEEKAPTGYAPSDFVLTGTITQNAETGRAEFKWTSTEVSNKLTYNPDGSVNFQEEQYFAGVKFSKIDAERNDAVPQGSATLQNAEITIYNNSGDAITLADGRTVANGAAIITIKTDADGIAQTAADALPAGGNAYYAVETKASTGYKLNSTWRIDFTVNDSQAGTVIDQTQTANKLPETPIRGGVKIEKWDIDLAAHVAQGDADFSGIQFAITTINTNPVRVNGTDYANGQVVYTMTTNAAGDATTTADLLPYGQYQIKEVATNGSYLLTNGTPQTFWIDTDGQIVSANTEGNAIHFDDEIHKGQGQIIKSDDDLAEAIAQGDASFAGIRYAIVNQSTKDVKVGGTVYAPGQVVMVIELNTDGIATTGERTLPYGTYGVYELRIDATIAAGDVYAGSDKLGTSIYANNNGYLFKEQSSDRLEIREDGETKSARFSDKVVTGYAKVTKKDVELDDSTPQGDASFEGIKYAVVNNSNAAVVVEDVTYAKGVVVAIIELDANGEATTTEELPYGTYQIYELRADATIEVGDTYAGSDKLGTSVYANENGYMWESQMQPVEIREQDEVAEAEFADAPVRGDVWVEKWDVELDEQRAQGDADFSGIKFEITNQSARAVVVDGQLYEVGEVVATIESNEDGNAYTSNNLLPYGTYTIKEVATNNSYLLTDGTEYTFEIREFNWVVFKDTSDTDLVFKDEVVRGGVKFLKIDKELNEATAQGQATLAGATIEIVNTSKEPVVVDGTEYAVGEVVLTLTTDENGECETAADALPYGTYEAHEGEESVGYLPSDWKVVFQIREDGKIVDTSSEDDKVTAADELSGWISVEENSSSSVAAQLPEQIKRLDLSFFKVDIDGNPMAGIPFLVSLLDEDGNVIESHVIVSNSEGGVNTKTRAKTADNINVLDEYVVNGKFTDESMLDGYANIWFGALDPESMASEKGALIYGQYRIEELQCDANKGQTMLSQIVFSDSEDLKVEFVDGSVKVVGNVFVDLTVHPESDLIDDRSGSKTVTFGSVVTVTDTFRFDHLKVTQTYELTTQIYYEDREGSTKLIGENTIFFSPMKVDQTNTAYGAVDNQITIDTSWMNGGKIHAKDILSVMIDGKKIELVSHNDELNIDSQMLVVPWMGTTAADIRTKSHVGTVEVEAGISDIIRYESLADSHMYRIVGILREADSGTIVKDADGNDCIVETVLRISKSATNVTKKSYGYLGPVSGELTMPEFCLDSTAYAGKTLVVTEILYDYDLYDEDLDWSENEDAIILRHDSLTNKEQSVAYPLLHTLATDGVTKDHIGLANDKMTLTDLITYENLWIDEDNPRSYTIKGIIMVADTEKPLMINGEYVTAEIIIRPETAEGEAIMVFGPFDSSNLSGHKLVVYEVLYDTETGERLVGHEEITSYSQSVTIPGGHTSASDALTGSHLGRASEEVRVVDRYWYEGLIPDREYRIEAKVYIRETGEPLKVDGKEIAKEVVFSAAQPQGYIDIEFEPFDGRFLQNQTVVVAETLYWGDFTVHVHFDLEGDEEQAIHYPSIGTTLLDQKTEEHIASADKKMTWVDKVEYSNLICDGREYELEGELFDASTGKSLGITSSLKFVPTTPNGVVDVTFEVERSKVLGKQTVCFEELYWEGNLLADHRIIDSPDQTVTTPDIGTKATDVVTENQTMLAEVNRTIKDVCSFTGLIPNRTYKVSGVIMDKETKAPLLVNGEKVVAETKFQPEESEGEVTLYYDVDASALAGKVLVVFETLYIQNKDVYYEVAIEDSFDNPDQTIYVPCIGTKATVNGQKSVNASAGIITITDEVSYKNLVPNVEFTLQARLMDRQTGNPAMLDGKEIKVEVKLTSDQPDGTIFVELQVNASDYPDHDLVVFETLIQTDIQKVIGRHEDLNDADQTIHVTKHPNTGDSTNVGCWIAVLMISFGFLAWCIYQERKMRLK